MTSEPAHRHTRAFCVGQAKSGTASLHGLLGARYRSAHEPERADLLREILREARGEIGEAELRAYLLERDRRLGLDFDIAWANQFVVGHLVAAFPDARFLVLVRDPYTWLQSIVGHLISRNVPPDVRAFLDWWFQPARHPHAPEDHALEARGLYSTTAFLAAWRRHVERCADAIPPPRRLVLRTHELPRSHARLAEFLGLPLEDLDGERGHLNRGTWSGSITALVAPDYLEDRVRAVCGEPMRTLFPEVSSLGDAAALWEPPSERAAAGP